MYNAQQQQMFAHAQQQMQAAAAAAALRHYHQYAAAAAAAASSAARPGQTKLQGAGQRPVAADMRISSFQQITPPESLAFWQQQHASAVASMCRSACCTTTSRPAAASAANPAGATYLNYSPPLVGLQHAGQPALPPCCYALPPTPMPGMGTAGWPGCISCAQGKCPQVNVNKENLGIMRSL